MGLWVQKVTSQAFQQRRPLCCLQVGHNNPPWSREGSLHWISPHFNASVGPPLEPRQMVSINCGDSFLMFDKERYRMSSFVSSDKSSSCHCANVHRFSFFIDYDIIPLLMLINGDWCWLRLMLMLWPLAVTPGVTHVGCPRPLKCDPTDSSHPEHLVSGLGAGANIDTDIFSCWDSSQWKVIL